MTTYNVDAYTFEVLEPNLKRDGSDLLYKGSDKSGNTVYIVISNKSGGVYSLKSIKNRKGGASFTNIIEENQPPDWKPPPKRSIKQPSQPIKQTVVHRQPIINPNDDDAQSTAELTDVNADLRAEGEPELDSHVPRSDLREISGLRDNIRMIDSNLAAARTELREEEGDINKIKEIKSERALDEPDQNKIKHREEEVREREESYFANQRRYEDLNIDMKNQVERIRSIIRSERPLGDRLRELFKKEEITIASVTTAIGLIISTIVLAATRLTTIVTPTPSPTPTPKPSPGRGFVDSVKAALKKIASYLKRLAGKAAASIPGLIGSIISWLFKAASKVVEVLANNVIILIIALIGLLFAVLTSQIRRGTKVLSKDH